MIIEQGLLPGQVLQRNRNHTAAARVRGNTVASGVVECRIYRASGHLLRGFDWKSVGTATGQTFVAALEKIPTGGPYSVSLRIRDGEKALAEITIDDICVGDVWFLGGQSNMQGVGKLAEGPRPHPLVRAFYLRDEWAVAQEPLHFLPEAVDPVYNGYGNGPRRPATADLEKLRRTAVKGVGPALFFALEMQRRTRVPQGLVPCALGGTIMEQWSPAWRDRGGASLYGAMLRRFAKLGQPITGILWYQGESDTNKPAADIIPYTGQMEALVTAVRRDMGLPNLPWLMVQLGRHVETFRDGWNRVQEQQRRLPERIPHLAVVPAVDLEIDDPIHICSHDQAMLGKRLARVAERLVHGNRTCKPAIAYAGCEVIPVNTLTESTVRLRYRNVAGRLQSAGRPHGFTLHDASGAMVERGVCKIILDKDTVILTVWLPLRSLPGHAICYGFGMNPYCNITDSEGMGLPAMLCQPLGVKAFLPYALTWESALLRRDGGLDGLDLPESCACPAWQKCDIGGGFVALPCPLGGNRAGTYAMRTVVHGTEALQAELQVGADSPFILWLNGKKIFEDFAATNPVAPGKYKCMVDLRQGKNEITAVFDTRQGAGWGLCLTLEELPGEPSLAGRVIL